MNMTLIERARSPLNNSNLQQELWVKETITTAFYLVNWSPSVAIDCKIPEEVWIGHPFDYSNLKIFGCEAYALIHKNQCSKLNSKSKKYISVGYDYVVKGYRSWDPTTHKIIIRRDVFFDESPLTKSYVLEVEVK